MARIALFLMCCTILFQSIQRTWIVASWKMNQSYIATALCENRMEEKSCCAGSCYLNKQLQENEDKQESTPLNDKQRVEYVINLFGSALSFIDHYSYTITPTFAALLVEHPMDFSESIFHPPSLIVG